METETFYFWTFCLFSLFLGKAISTCLFPEPAKFLEAYGGCECGNEDCKKIDMFESHGKIYRRIIQERSTKMTYKYSKIYNVTQGVWAHNVAGEDYEEQVWEDNEWNENDALIGFYDDDKLDERYKVIFCRPGYAIYVQAEEDKNRADFEFENSHYRIPPAILVNLNDAYDGEFMYNKAYPESDDSSEASDEYVEVRARVPKNQYVIDFLYKCRRATDNNYKKKAYDNAINEVKDYWSTINSNTWVPYTIGPHIERKIREFIDGFPEDDIINS
jgi:hypothetical protein